MYAVDVWENGSMQVFILYTVTYLNSWWKY